MSFDLAAVMDTVDRVSGGGSAGRAVNVSNAPNNSVSVNPAITVIGGSGSPGVTTSGSASGSPSATTPIAGYGSGAPSVQADLDGFGYDFDYGGNVESAGLLDDLSPETMIMGVLAIGAGVYLMAQGG